MVLFAILGAFTLYFYPSFFVNRMDYKCWDQNWNKYCDIDYDDYNHDGVCDERDCGVFHDALSMIVAMFRGRNATINAHNAIIKQIGLLLNRTIANVTHYNATVNAIVEGMNTTRQLFDDVRAAVQSESRGSKGQKGDKGYAGVVTYSIGDDGMKGDKGDKGSTQIGVTGAKGSSGSDGPKGERGDTGPLYVGIDISGPQGDTGAKGVAGNDGPTGDTGDTGIVGIDGDTGDTGVTPPKGAKGMVGDTGVKGVKGSGGDTGSTGINGDIGVTGDKGGQGANGSVGIAGAKGVQGAKGASGINGDKGTPGVAGAKGMRGDDGDTGQKGQKGVQGAKGMPGDQGSTGVKGTQGAKGDIGPTGDTGLSGDTGSTGVDGVAGPNGATGDTGSTGSKGAKGVTGDAGVVGATGDTGAKGVKGTAGAKGSIGDTGATGATGASGAASAATYPFCDNTMVRVGGNRILVHEMMGSDSSFYQASASSSAFTTNALSVIYGASGTLSHDTALALSFGVNGLSIVPSGSTQTNAYVTVAPLQIWRCVVCSGFTVFIMRFYIGIPSSPGTEQDVCMNRLFGLVSLTTTNVATTSSYIYVQSSLSVAATLNIRINSGTITTYPILCAGASFFSTSAWATVEFVIQGLTGLFNLKLNGITCTVTGLTTITSTLTVGLTPFASASTSSCSIPTQWSQFVVVDFVHFSSVYIDGDVTV
jgi:hypothetical protein